MWCPEREEERKVGQQVLAEFTVTRAQTAPCPGLSAPCKDRETWRCRGPLHVGCGLGHALMLWRAELCLPGSQGTDLTVDSSRALA